jgi:hypothetical protein
MTKKKAAAKTKAKKAAPKPKKAPVAKHKIARQKSLPGMEDTKIAGIESCALDYAEMRDERQRIGKDEVTLKNRLLDLMHKAGKTEYHRNGISITVVTEKEMVKVRVKSESSDEVEVSDTDQPEVEMPDEIEEEVAS